MRLILQDKNRLVFQMSKREKHLLVDVLKLYPLIPSSHHRVSRFEDSPAIQASQKLLDEALAEQRQETKRQLQAMLGEEGRFIADQSGYRCSLSHGQVDWLLQVLNDIRVGSWLILGEPDEKNGKHIELTPQNARFLWVMEMSGYFESILLEALDGSSMA